MTVAPRTITRSAYLRWAIGAALLVVLGAGPFVSVFPREFTNWDDQAYVVDNPPLRYLTVTNVGYLFSHQIGANYVPLTSLSQALDWIVHGDDAWGHGLTNALLHCACSALLWGILRKAGMTASTAGLAALFFAVHPVHTENVSWISGRKDLLCAAALFACQSCWIAWRKVSRRSLYALSLIWLAIAGLSKPMALSAAAVLLLYDVFVGQLSLRQSLRDLWPHALFCFAIGVVAFLAQRAGTAIATETDGRWGAIDVASTTLLYGLLRSGAPLDFSPYYPGNVISDVSPLIRWSAPLVVAAVSVWLATGSRRSAGIHGAAFWWFGSLAFLLPVSGLIPIGHTSLADRYLYLPSIGPCVAAALLLHRITRSTPRALPVLAGLLLIALAGITHHRATAWSDSATLWQRTLARFPTSGLAWRNLTSAYYRSNRLTEAAQIAVQGAEAAPDDLPTGLNAVTLLMATRAFADASALLDGIEHRHPRSAAILNQRGLLALRQNDPEAARRFLSEAAEMQPDWEQPPLNLSYAAAQLNDWVAAESAARRAVALAPRDREVHSRLVTLLIGRNQSEAALAAAADMAKALPYAIEGWQLRIAILNQMGNSVEARAVTSLATQRFRPEELAR